MSNNQITMQKLRQIIRLYCQGTGLKTISWMINTSRNTVKKYVTIWHSLGISHSEFSSKDDFELSELFSTKSISVKLNQRQEDLNALLPQFSKDLNQKGMTKDKLHQQYLLQYPDGYSRSQFNNTFRIHLSLSRPVMHLEHKAGEKMYIDFTGSKLQLIETDGATKEIEVFVSILGCSQLTYVEAVYSQKKEDLIKASENSLHYFGGVPSVIVPDNLRSAVTKSSKYEAILNEDFASFCDHYGMTAIPARAYKPKDKALVEGAVKLIYQSIYTHLYDRKFYDLASLNVAIRSALEDHNNKFFSGRTYSRRDQFEEIERDTLSPLNPLRYEIKKQVIVTVMKNGHIRLGEDIHYYSVPYKYIGKKVKILYTSDKIDVYYRYLQIASHERKMKKYRYTTTTDHLAPQHQFLSEWTPDKFIQKAINIDEEVAKYISKVLEKKVYPEQSYKSCSGILNFASKVGAERLIAACRLADSLKQYNYLIIEEILRKKLDQLSCEDELTQIPTHDNIRGKEYYN